MAKRKIIIVGGGAAGLMAAITSARAGAKVTLLEGKDRVGKKILATGNGRCNLSNRGVAADKYHSDSHNLFEEIYKQLPLDKTLQFFSDIGIEVVELEEGKLYPMSLQAASVLNVMRFEAERLGVTTVCNAEVTSIEMEPKVKVYTKEKTYYGDRVIMATGGKSAPDLGSNGSGYRLMESLGLPLITPYPTLVQLTSDYRYLKHLKGTKIMAELSILVDERVCRKEYGELLFTDYGISGPPVLQLSRHGSKAIHHNIKGVQVKVDLLPKLDQEALDKMLIKRIEQMPYKTMETFFEGMLPKALIIPVIKDNGLETDLKAADMTKVMRQNVVNWLKGLTLDITGTRQWNQAQATAGGIDCSQVDQNSLATFVYPDLYLCGELLDMDGDCGGYNLQWAWSSGYVAGVHAAQ